MAILPLCLAMAMTACGGNADTERGKELFQSAVDRGVVEGYYGLALVAGNEEDFATALEYYNKVVEDGTEQLYITNAMCMYQFGAGSIQAETYACRIFQEQNEAGTATGKLQTRKHKSKSNLTLVGAVAFLMSFISSGLPDTDHRDDDADDRHCNTGKFQNHSKHQ